MKIEDIISYFNKQLQEKRVSLNHTGKEHLVLQKQIFPHSTFKAYKTFKYILWYVGEVTSEIKTFEVTDKVLEGSEDKILNRLNEDLIIWLFNLIQSNLYNLILRGNINGDIGKNTN